MSCVGINPPCLLIYGVSGPEGRGGADVDSRACLSATVHASAPTVRIALLGPVKGFGFEQESKQMLALMPAGMSFLLMVVREWGSCRRGV